MNRSLCSEASIVDDGETPRAEGSPTECALVELAMNAGIDVAALRARHPCVRKRYRAEGRPYMSTVHATGQGGHLLAVKGSPEQVLTLCDFRMKSGKRVRLGTG